MGVREREVPKFEHYVRHPIWILGVLYFRALVSEPTDHYT